jgi:hypothetical protein
MAQNGLMPVQFKAQLDHLDHREPKEHKVFRALLGQRVIKEMMARLGLKVHKEIQGHKVDKVHKAHKA